MSTPPAAQTRPLGPVVHRLRVDRIDWRAVEGEVVALDRAHAAYLAVNPVGTAVWQALVDGATVDELVDVVTGRFEVGPAEARRDIEAFLADLGQRRLLAT